MNEASRLTNDFMQNYPIARFGKGQLILRPGDELTKIHYLIEGTVVQYDISETGSIVIVNSFRPGSFFPLSHVFTGTTLDYFFEADSPVSTRVAPSDRIIDFITNTPAAMHDALLDSYQGSEELLRRISYIMGGSATSRIIYELLTAARHIGERNADGSIFIALSENDIAKRAGLSRETVNRMLRTFKSSGIIRATNQGMVLSSLSALHEVLERE